MEWSLLSFFSNHIFTALKSFISSVLTSITRNHASKVELASLLLTHPLPVLLAITLLVFHVYQTSRQCSRSCKIQLTLCVIYLLTIFPSLVVDNLASSVNTCLLVIIKFNLASSHILLEPFILMMFRSDLRTNVKNIFTRK